MVMSVLWLEIVQCSERHGGAGQQSERHDGGCGPVLCGQHGSHGHLQLQQQRHRQSGGGQQPPPRSAAGALRPNRALALDRGRRPGERHAAGQRGRGARPRPPAASASWLSSTRRTRGGAALPRCRTARAATASWWRWPTAACSSTPWTRTSPSTPRGAFVAQEVYESGRWARGSAR